MDYKILPVGDSALTIVFGKEIDPETSRIVRVARKYLTKKNIKGVSEYVQTYATLMVHYRPVAIGYDELAERIELELSQMDLGSGRMKKKTIVIPVCYGGEFGPDLHTVAEHAGISEEEVVKRLIEKKYGNPDLSDEKTRMKVMSYLARRGFRLT